MHALRKHLNDYTEHTNTAVLSQGADYAFTATPNFTGSYGQSAGHQHEAQCLRSGVLRVACGQTMLPSPS